MEPTHLGSSPQAAASQIGDLGQVPYPLGEKSKFSDCNAVILYKARRTIKLERSMAAIWSYWCCRHSNQRTTFSGAGA